MQADPVQLAHDAAHGDQAALAQLLELYLPELRAFVRLRLGPLIRARESSSDIVQSVCREVIEHADRFQFASSTAFKTWLFTTALRTLSKRRDFYLAERRDVRREVAPETETHAGASHADARVFACYQTLSTPSRKLMTSEALARIEATFDELPDDYREVITLARIVGLSRGEIATSMGRSEGSVRMLLHRALSELAERLQRGPASAD